MVSRIVLSLALALAPAPLLAQAVVQPLTQSDADALAEQVRRLGANAQDLDALLTAGELATRMDDLPAASAFFARAEKVDARNARAKAGEAAVLVRSERPAEGLRYFAQAEALGLPAQRFAADRGLAYDLLGDQGRAQRDYRLALGLRDDDETRRRYGLSLGIAGRQREALETLAPLVQKNDRAAWRDRAFVLAMGGDAAEASRIAQTMMPPGSAQGLRTFFAELPRLPAIDRAFAVHFGEVHPSATRLADARTAPTLEPLPPEPVAVAAAVPATLAPERRKNRHGRGTAPSVVTLAAAPPPPAVTPEPPAYRAPAYQPPAAPVVAGADRPLSAGERASLAAAGLRDTGSRRSARAASATAALPASGPALTPAEQASLAAATLPSRRSHRGGAAVTNPPVAVAALSPADVSRPTAASAPPSVSAIQPTAAPPPLSPAEQASLAAATLPRRGSRPSPAPTPALSYAPTTAIAAASTRAPASPPARADRPLTTGEQASLAAADAPSQRGTELAAALPAMSPVPSAAEPANDAPAGATGEPATPAVTTAVPVPVEPVPAPVVASLSPVSAASAPRLPRRSHAQADAILGRIVAGLSIPASELGVGGKAAAGQLASADRPSASRTGRTGDRHPNPPEATTPDDLLAAARTPAARRAAARQLAQEKKAAAGLDAMADDAAAKTPAQRRVAARKAAAQADEAADAPVTQTPAEKRAAARLAAADRKAAADKKAAAEAAAAEKKAAKAEPVRYWVQVGGGADPKGLGKAWNQIKAKAPDAFAGRKPYTTPLRFTHRVLTGPFKTADEAQAYVNKLIKAGVNAFSFTSTAGQKVSRLDTE